MTIVYQDDLGYIVAHPDQDIIFSDGIAMFDMDGKETQIPIADIYLITND